MYVVRVLPRPAQATDEGAAVNNDQAKHSAEPGLTEVLELVKSARAFSTTAISKVDLPAGALFSRITVATAATKAYTTVQTSEDTHVELNSDLVYCDHSCKPSLIFDMHKMEVRVADGLGLKKGDALTFFYPSTEWDMNLPFKCQCKLPECCGRISGACHMDEKLLRRYWLNPHIEALLAKNGTTTTTTITAEEATDITSTDAEQ